MRPLAALCFFLAAAALAQQRTWAPICERVKDVEPPAADRPAPEAKAALKGCYSRDLYYGFDKSPDYVKARQCAYLEMERPWSPALDVMTGPSILMMIYANGKGVPRNPDLALKFACQLEEHAAEAEMQARTAHLDRMRADPKAKIDICDDITSGLWGGFCAGIDAASADAARKRKMKALTARWPAAHRQALGALEEVFEEFVKTRQDNEVDMTGTARADFYITEGKRLRDRFAAALEEFERGKLPAASAQEFRAADAGLNRVYAKVMAAKPRDYYTVKPEGVRTTQRVWIRYRDAWVVFGRVRYPSVTADAWKTWLTRARTQMLTRLAM